jgi:phosphoenolpyruvate carboxylase
LPDLELDSRVDARLKQEIRFLTTRLGVIIREQAGERVFRQVEGIRRLAKAIRAHANRQDIAAARNLVQKLTIEEADQVAHAFSLFFQITNLCEERARIRHLEASAEPSQSLARLFREFFPCFRVCECISRGPTPGTF